MKNEKFVKINLIIDVSSVCPSPEKGNLFALTKGYSRHQDILASISLQLAHSV